MTREQFFQIMENPSKAGASDLQALRELGERFPWFSLAHTLTATAHHHKQSANRIDLLKIAAVYSGNRKVLFDDIDRERLRKTIASFEVQIESPETIGNLDDSEPSEATKLADKKTKEATESEFLAQQSETEQPAVTQDFASLLLEEEIMLEALATVIEREISPSDYFEAQSPPHIQAKAYESIDLEDPFAYWLLERSSGIGYEVQSQIANAPSSSPIIPEKKSVADLIDNFIKNEPKITPGKAEEYANKVHGANALVEDENFVTETLASIYARQGKTAKAKRAYKLLSLKYPEKSIYFAAQIKKIDRGEL